MSDAVFSILLILHVSGGACALLAGGFNLYRKKGDIHHRRRGRIFLVAMIVSGGSALLLSCLHPNVFLFMIAVFSLYLVVTGDRSLRGKDPARWAKPAVFDWILTMGMLLAASGFLIVGLRVLSQQDAFGWVCLVFGGVGILMVRADLKRYFGKSAAENRWLLDHLQRMTGATIAALTAFLVVNLEHFPVRLPAALAWLLPTLLLTPWIIIWSRRYKSRQTS